MTLPEVMVSISNRLDKILAMSPEVAYVLQKHPELLEKEPILQEFVKTTALQQRWIDHRQHAERKNDKSRRSPRQKAS